MSGAPGAVNVKAIAGAVNASRSLARRVQFKSSDVSDVLPRGRTTPDDKFEQWLPRV